MSPFEIAGERREAAAWVYALNHMSLYVMPSHSPESSLSFFVLRITFYCFSEGV